MELVISQGFSFFSFLCLHPPTHSPSLLLCRSGAISCSAEGAVTAVLPGVRVSLIAYLMQIHFWTEETKGWQRLTGRTPLPPHLHLLLLPPVKHRGKAQLDGRLLTHPKIQVLKLRRREEFFRVTRKYGGAFYTFI